MSDVKYDAEQLIKDAEEHLSQFKNSMRAICEDTIGEIYVNVLPHIETDAWTNYREQLRLELEHEYKHTRFKSEWAKDFRRSVFVENREEMIKLVNHDLYLKLKELENRHQEYEMFRYSPRGDCYQDILAQLNKYKEKYGDL